VTINDETNALYPHNSAGPDSQTQVWQYICLSGTTLHFFLYFAFLRWVLPDQGMILFLLYFFNDFLNLLAAEIPSGAEAISLGITYLMASWSRYINKPAYLTSATHRLIVSRFRETSIKPPNLLTYKNRVMNEDSVRPLYISWYVS